MPVVSLNKIALSSTDSKKTQEFNLNSMQLKFMKFVVSCFKKAYEQEKKINAYLRQKKFNRKLYYCQKSYFE
jgi:hypothetical protein